MFRKYYFYIPTCGTSKRLKMVESAVHYLLNIKMELLVGRYVLNLLLTANVVCKLFLTSIFEANKLVQVRESLAPLNIPTPTPAPTTLLGDT